MDNIENILSTIDDIDDSSNILFTKKDIDCIINIHGNQESRDEEIREIIRNGETNGVNVDDWFN